MSTEHDDEPHRDEAAGSDSRAWIAAAAAGDDAAFGALVDRYRPELVLHCYRLLGRHDEAEDSTQDALLRAWRGLSGYRGDASVRTWLYRIATRCCLDRRSRDRRRQDLIAAGTVADGVAIPIAATVPWLQGMPEATIDAADLRRPGTDDRVTARETLELGYIAALQHLTDRQRTVLVLRDVVDWPIPRIAEHLDTTNGATQALLRRGRGILRDVLGPDRDDWSSTSTQTDTTEVRDLLRRYVTAVENGDDHGLAGLLAEDVVVSHQPMAGQPTAEVGWYAGRDAVLEAWAPALHGTPPLDLRETALFVNRCPAVATWARLPGTDGHRAFGLAVLRVVDGAIIEIVNLATDHFPALGLPMVLDGQDPHQESPNQQEKS